MMAIDTIAFLINQRYLSRCIDRLEIIDRKLAQENIKINYASLQYISYGLIIGASLRKYVMVFFAFLAFSTSLWHIFCLYLPIYISTLSKVWFVMLLCNIRMKFNAMNNYLEMLSAKLSALKQSLGDVNTTNRANVTEPDVQPNHHLNMVSPLAVSYLHKEIMPQAQKAFRFNGRSVIGPMVQLIRPFESSGWLGSDVDMIEVSRRQSLPNNEFFDRKFESLAVKLETHKLHIADKFDMKLTKLCYWHDEICDIGKIVNVLFSFQMLVLLAYAFLSITAQFYFVYCGLVQQPVPLLFKSAENISISMVYFATTAFCCVYIVYICWETKNASGQMGVFLYKVANIVDENHFYETVRVRHK